MAARTTSIALRAKLARAVGHAPGRRFTVRDRLARLLLAPETGEAPFEVGLAGQRYRGRLGNYIDWSIYVFGAYEAPLLDLLGALAGERGGRGLFLDIGANSGQHSLFMSTKMERVISIEPYPPLAERIESLIRLNALEARWRLLPIGLGDREEMLRFSPPGPENLGVGSFAYARPGESLELPVRRGDDLEGLEDLAIVKLDVEGFEKPALAGLSETIARTRPDIVMEWSPRTGEDFGGLLAVLPEGYLAFDLARRPLAAADAAPADLLLRPRERV